MTKALLLIDIQNDYFPGGKMVLSGIDRAAKNAGLLLEVFRKKSLPIYHIQHISIRPDAGFLLPNTEGVKINKNVVPLQTETIIEKNYPNSFRDTWLHKALRAQDIKHLIIAGAMSHMCIDATTRAAFDYGFKCTVVNDACATRDLKFGELIVPADYVHAGFMSALSGVYAEIKNTTDIE